MKNLKYIMIRNGFLLVVLLICSFLCIGCNHSKPKEDSVRMQIQDSIRRARMEQMALEEQNDVQYKKYEDYTYDEFSRLPHDVQYSLKFPNDVDTIITVDYGWMDTVYTEDGTPLKIEKSSRTCNLVLEKDTMKLYYPYMAKPDLSFFSNEKIYDKRINDFSNHFSFEFKYNKKMKYYYLLKTEFPNGITFEHELYTLNKPSIHRLSPIDKKYKKMVNELYSVDFLYSFTESCYYEYGHWVCEENEITKFENWLNSK